MPKPVNPALVNPDVLTAVVPKSVGVFFRSLADERRVSTSKIIRDLLTQYAENYEADAQKGVD